MILSDAEEDEESRINFFLVVSGGPGVPLYIIISYVKYNFLDIGDTGRYWGDVAWTQGGYNFRQGMESSI
jgi:hypothetical protein